MGELVNKSSSLGADKAKNKDSSSLGLQIFRGEIDMSDYKINYSAPNILSICVDDVNSEGYTGRLYHRYSKVPIEFRDTSSMLTSMDTFYDWIGYPQSSTESRSFRDRPERVMAKKKGDVKMLNDEYVTGKTGDKATFVVHVKYRQNATWQGSVVWADKNKTCNFRSALELLKLIDSALDTTMGMEGDEEPGDA